MMKTLTINAEGKAVGRVASEVAKMLQGKSDPNFIPHLDPLTTVIIKNAGKVIFTGRKLEQKDYRHHTMHPGGLKIKPMKKVFIEDSTEVMRKAVNGMIPKNRRREDLMKRLIIEA
ncbi:MAG: 50S ribosomal protein L13 [Candidatus Magasanikbacteria bacterium RIFCSPHIGHO2_01_FULL_41_23]|uniref:Large ribosomal subunit protein uL13 n=1 Tax=Candidatus Magasanikbacteria bacterium RIFCSPLOWO2_01_FULL_40_15 TaxID=1798686 RepID=A0A1F6N2R4_9BACT|nr:MAG: 50S ribosomal protein L13 [Candidatus Magasanikbacteria bacterium RIFCSPHIGHO2_01_FULL_41_23]OGH76467.1 MAG: 50S ribosomal protein L13 [Candidatus Magasanikbacteria bacterium RIFCSPHIGHO2_12_FULL_41_16]OGH77953.1 MAG: 50S ribosomal protein L13 [Candidatus Magasanikbacteria bacterium RIFCSPLOWO2_01_FULL_40_15]